MPQVQPLQTSPHFWFWAPLSLLQPANLMQILSEYFFPQNFPAPITAKVSCPSQVTEIKFSAFRIPSKYKKYENSMSTSFRWVPC